MTRLELSKVTGLIIESEGQVCIGQVCSISSDRHGDSTEAQVVGFSENKVLLMPLESVHLIHPDVMSFQRKTQLRSFW